MGLQAAKLASCWSTLQEAVQHRATLRVHAARARGYMYGALCSKHYERWHRFAMRRRLAQTLFDMTSAHGAELRYSIRRLRAHARAHKSEFEAHIEARSHIRRTRMANAWAQLCSQLTRGALRRHHVLMSASYFLSEGTSRPATPLPAAVTRLNTGRPEYNLPRRVPIDS